MGFGAGFGFGAGLEPPGWTVRPPPCDVVTETTCLAASADACALGRRAACVLTLAGRAGAGGSVGPKVIFGSGATRSTGTATGAGVDGSSTARQR